MAVRRAGDFDFSDQYPPKKVGWIIAAGVVALVVVIALFQSVYVIQPGNRGVMVTLGTTSQQFLPEGMGFKVPFITKIYPVSVRQNTREFQSDCYSSDLQQLKVNVKVLYSIPEAQVVRAFTDYAGDPFETLVVPRVQEALKEQTAMQSAEMIVKQREVIKSAAITSARAKVGDMLRIEDVVIENIDLTDQLENAIEAKMVQEQEASKSKFVQEKAKIDAETMLIKAKAEAESIMIKGKALKESPDLIDLNIVEKWDGRTPLVVGGGGNGGTGGPGSFLLPLQERREALPQR
jgi:prohibitin 2